MDDNNEKCYFEATLAEMYKYQSSDVTEWHVLMDVYHYYLVVQVTTLFMTFA